MENKSLAFNLKISVPDTELVIDNLDIDFNIYKNNKPENNRAYINIWNLDQTIYQQLTEQDKIIEIYTSYGEDEPCLLFRGNIEYDKIKKGSPINRVDNLTKLTLIDGYKAYSTFINRNYRERVSSTQIIQDIIKDMQIGQGIMSEKLPLCQFNSYKAYGRAPVILKNICSPLGINFSVQNNLINFTSDTDDSEETDGNIFNEENCGNLRLSGKDEIIITTTLTPHLIPNDIIQCEFEEFKGSSRINDIHHFGNNYGRAGVTEITVEVNTNV